MDSSSRLPNPASSLMFNHFRSPWEMESISNLIAECLEQCRSEIAKNSMRVVLDLQSIDAWVKSALLRAAILGLLRNAIEVTPNGGELTITTIDGEYHWEIEFADTTDQMPISDFHKFEAERKPHQTENLTNKKLPVLLEFPSTEFLRSACHDAIELGGQIQSIRCPMGGVAHILSAPHRKSTPTPRQNPQ